MENNSTSRIEALQELSFEHWVSKIEITTQTETHIVGLGRGGTNAVKYIWNQWEKGRFTVINDPDNADIPDGINLIPFHSPKIRKFSGKHRDFYIPDIDQALELPDELTGLFRENCRLVLLAGLGGYTGTKMAEALSLMLHKEQKDFLTICSMPFSFEGRNRLTIARESKERMKAIPNCYFFELDMLRNDYVNMALSEAFTAADRCFYKILQKSGLV